jgi:hypothetical protein
MPETTDGNKHLEDTAKELEPTIPELSSGKSWLQSATESMSGFSPSLSGVKEGNKRITSSIEAKKLDIASMGMKNISESGMLEMFSGTLSDAAKCIMKEEMVHAGIIKKLEEVIRVSIEASIARSIQTELDKQDTPAPPSSSSYFKTTADDSNRETSNATNDENEVVALDNSAVLTSEP